jgi:hypothetical protein
MNKKTTLVVIAVVVVGVLLLGVMVMRMRRGAMMMGGGSDMPLKAVSSEGTDISLSEEVKAVTGELLMGASAQKVGDMIVQINLNPYPPAVASNEFTVTLTDASGQAINDATVSLDLTMPAMHMPPNQPELPFVADGKYAGSAPFTMRGWWRIEVIITRGGEKRSAFFDLGM